MSLKPCSILPKTDKCSKCLLRNETALENNLPRTLKPILNLSNRVNNGKREIQTHKRKQNAIIACFYGFFMTRVSQHMCARAKF